MSTRRRGGDKVAEVSEARSRVRDTYGIEIVLGEDDVPHPRRQVCIDEMALGPTAERRTVPG